MQNKIHDGGPAFPSEEFFDSSTGKITLGGQGMSIRDYFAAKALPGLMTRNWSNHKGSDEELIEIWVYASYAIADTMLKARSK